jgi:hypothetical protein
VAEGQDLGVLRRLAAAQQVQPAKDPDDGEVQKSDRHNPRSCLIAVSAPNRRSRPSHRVLERYRLVDEYAAGRVAHASGVDASEFVEAVTDALMRAGQDAVVPRAALDSAQRGGLGLESQ